jgi:hypothetical protein
MRESVFFEASLRRFEVWRGAVVVVGVLAISALTAWALAMSASEPEPGAMLVAAVAVLLGVVTAWAIWSLTRVERGVLSCRDGTWTFVSDVGAARSGVLEVAIDLGAFLLLRLDRGGAGLWLPVQRRGLESQWHALRCAVYAPPALVDAPPPGFGSAPASPSSLE